ncbi:MAG: hypothetical protein AABX51_08605 [Nanoarchaeota archaeon]
MKTLIKFWPFAVVFLVALAYAAQAEPVGANATKVGNSQRAGLYNTSLSVPAQAGNVTEVLVVSNSVTKHWQGYFGNVTGSIILANAAGNNLYQWPMGIVRGEIFASRNSSRINWTGVNCAAQGNVVNEDAYVNASPTIDLDSVNQTFNYTTHPTFQISSNTLTGCPSTPVNGSSATAAGFWNVFLTDNGTDPVSSIDDISIYATLIDADKIGFNGNTYDFQMLVGENGNGSEEFPNGNPTTYFFYVELS